MTQKVVHGASRTCTPALRKQKQTQLVWGSEISVVPLWWCLLISGLWFIGEEKVLETSFLALG